MSNKDYSKSYFKNKIIFKSIFEDISPINKVWNMKNFDVGKVFEDPIEQKLYQSIKRFFSENHMFDYEKNNLYNIMILEIEKSADSKKDLEDISKYINELKDIDLKDDDLHYITKQIEFYIKSVATYHAINNSIGLFEKTKGRSFQDASKDFYDIFDLVEKSVKIQINDGDNLGIDLSNITAEMIKEAFEDQKKIPFSSSYPSLQTASDGGIPIKTVNVVLGASHIGKTRFLLNMAMDYFLSGKNVAYVTLEISEEEILRRTVSHVTHTPINKLKAHTSTNNLTLMKYKIKELGGVTGKLFIKEFPCSEFTPHDFNNYVHDFKSLPKEERPEVFFIDYLQIMGTNNRNMSANSYTLLKENIEKLRGVAQKNDIVVWTAAQLKRNSFNRIGNDMSDVGQSWAIIETADFVGILEENDTFKQYMTQILKIQKNRYGKPFDSPIFLELEDPWLFNIKEVVDDSKLNELSRVYETMDKKDKFDF